MKATTIFNQKQIDAEVAALHRDLDAKAKAEKAAEKQRITDISALGKAHGLMQECNDAIVNDLTADQFETASVVQKLQADKRALEELVAQSNRLPSRAALLSDPANARTDKLLDRYNEAKRLGDPKARYKAIAALKKAREENK